MNRTVKKIAPYGVKMYGSWTFFDTLKDALEWCLDGLCGTDGSEQERFADAIAYFREGWTHINTDK